MKGLQIALLVVAGAMTGAIVMMLLPRARQAEPASAPLPPVMAQVEKPSPTGAPPVDPPPVDSPQTVEAKPESVPTARPPARSIRERLNMTPNTPVRIPPAPPAAPERVADSTTHPGRPAPMSGRLAVAGTQPVRPKAVPGGTESRSSGIGIPQTHPEEAPQPVTPSVPAPLTETQERPTLPPNPPARTEPENSTPVPAPPPEPHRVTLNAGMLIPVRLADGLSTERNKPGDIFTATLVNELVADDFVIAERGARVEGLVVASDPGRLNGVARLTLMLTRLHTSDGQSVSIRTDGFERRAEPSSSAPDGSAAGTSRPSPGKTANLPADTRIRFRLGVAVTLTERTQ